MSPFDPDKYAASGSKFDPDAYAASKEYEQPGLAKRLYEQNVVIPVRAARHFAPNPEAIQERFIDPAIGYFTGETPEQRKANREEYDRYLQQQYPKAREFYESRGALVGGLAKGALAAVNPLMAAQQATEPLVEQLVTRPESVDFNPETAMSTANLLVPAALSAPKYAAKGIAGIKAGINEKPSLKAYMENPDPYDTYEAGAVGEPRRQLVEEVMTNLEGKVADKAGRLQSAQDAIEDARSSRSQAAKEITSHKRDISYERRNAAEDIRRATEINMTDADFAKNLTTELRKGYEATAAERNAHLMSENVHHDTTEIDDLFKSAIDQTTDPAQVAQLERARARLKTRALETTGDETAIASKDLNDFRAYLQNQVDYSSKLTPGERGFNDVANSINDILDNSIVGNEELRSTLKQQTVDYKDAMDLVGDKFNMSQLESTLRDPQKRVVIDRIAANNPDLPTLNNVKAKVDTRAKFDESQRRGIPIQVPSEKLLTQAETSREQAIRDYITARKQRTEIQKEQLPFRPEGTEAVINQKMVSNPMHPKVVQGEQLQSYAESVHPQGPEDFWNKYEKNKVLRDLDTLNATQGSRMTNIGRSAGGVVGGALSYLSGNPIMSAETGLAAGIGGLAGGYLDKNASSLFRSAARGAKATEPMSKAFYPFAGMSRQQAVQHFLRMSRQPQYAEEMRKQAEDKGN